MGDIVGNGVGSAVGNGVGTPVGDGVGNAVGIEVGGGVGDGLEAAAAAAAASEAALGWRISGDGETLEMAWLELSRCTAQRQIYDPQMHRFDKKNPPTRRRVRFESRLGPIRSSK